MIRKIKMSTRYGSNFEQILAIANDIRKDPKSEIARQLKQCPHRENLFDMHAAWRKSIKNEYVPKLNK